MKQKKEREKEISQWPWISMLPFGILAGYWGNKEVRITAISEYGFQTRLAAPATVEQKNAPWELAFYDQKTASYQRILLRDATFLQEKEEDFDVVYTFATEQEDSLKGGADKSEGLSLRRTRMTTCARLPASRRSR